MTYEHDQDLKALLIIQSLQPATKDVLSLAFTGIGIDPNGFIKRENTENLIKFSEADNLDDEKISLTQSGEIYLKWLLSEREKETVDLKIKKLTVANSKIQRVTVIASAIIAALSLITTIFVSYTKKNIPYIPIQQQQQLMQIQEQINKSLLQYQDSLKAHQK